MTQRVLVLLAAIVATAILGLNLRAQEGGGLSISGPAPDKTPAPATAPATTTPAAPAPTVPPPATPATAPATQNAAEAALNNLLHTPGAAPVMPAATLPSNPIAAPAATPVAPHVPGVNRLREGQPIWNRVGRLIKDQAGTGYLFAFEADNTTLQDPPMPLLPCRMLEQMEGAANSNAGNPVKFKVSGQVTEYHGKNYLLINFMQTVRDLNRGLN